MRALIKLTLALILVATAGGEIAAQENSDLVGSYVFRFQFGGGEIVLKNNGRFTSSSGGCTDVSTASGPYKVSNNVIRFTTLKLTTRSLSDNKEHDLTKRKARKKYLDTDEPFKPYSWELMIVRWGERVYLLNAKTVDAFVRAINLGFEPRAVEGYRDFYGDFYLRTGDENKPVTGRPPLPEQFLRDLLPGPVLATVMEVKTEDNVAVATIDRGRAHGLKEKMKLVPTTAMDFLQAYEIISIADHSAQVKVYGPLKVGDQVSTRIPDGRRF